MHTTLCQLSLPDHSRNYVLSLCCSRVFQEWCLYIGRTVCGDDDDDVSGWRQTYIEEYVTSEVSCWQGKSSMSLTLQPYFLIICHNSHLGWFYIHHIPHSKHLPNNYCIFLCCSEHSLPDFCCYHLMAHTWMHGLMNSHTHLLNRPWTLPVKPLPRRWWCQVWYVQVFAFTRKKHLSCYDDST